MGSCTSLPEISTTEKAISTAVELRTKNRQLVSARNLLKNKSVGSSQNMKLAVERSIRDLSESIVHLEMELDLLNTILVSNNMTPVTDKDQDVEQVQLVIDKVLMDITKFPPVPTHSLV